MDITGVDPPRAAGGRWGNDAVMAAVCFAGGALLLALGVYNRPPRAAPVALLVPLATICLALLIRRTAPLPAVLVGFAAAVADQVLGGSLGTVIVLAELVFDAGVYGRDWLARGLLRAAWLVTIMVAGIALAVDGATASAAFGISAGVVLVAPAVTALTVREHHDRAVAERQRAEQLARLAELDRRQAVSEERTRMARELHDVVANHFSAVAIHATAALSGREQPTGATRQALLTIRESSVAGLAEMRRMVVILRGGQSVAGPGSGRDRPAGDDPPVRSTVAEIEPLLERARATGLRVTATTAGTPYQLPAATDLAAYRIVQEALTNAVRHGQGGTATVEIAYGPDGLALTVDSRPAATPRPAGTGVPGAGVGLSGMRERAVALGGGFRAGPCGDGWRVTASLPVTGRAPGPGTGVEGVTMAGADGAA